MLFVVDAKAGITPGDEEVAQILRDVAQARLPAREQDRRPGRGTRSRSSSTGFGLGDPIPLSALHGYGTGDLLDAIVARLPGSGPAQVGEEAIRVAILGRPNVGKSSLLNAILGEERVIVSEVPGTTRDAIDTVFRRGDTTFVLVDTAGLRRKRRQRQGIEYYSELRALDAAERADVALVLVDASEGARRPGPRRRRRRPQGERRDARRPLEVGHRAGRRSRTSGRGIEHAPAAAARGRHRLGEDRPRRRPPARPHRGALRESTPRASRRRR